LLHYDREHPAIRCTVSNIRGDYVLCNADPEPAAFGRRKAEDWYNLGMMLEIERPAKD